MLEVEKNIIDQADNCPNSQMCLCDNNQPKCKIKEKTAYEICSEECFNLECSYKIKFMGKHYCICPVRKDIYNRYNK